AADPAQERSDAGPASPAPRDDQALSWSGSPEQRADRVAEPAALAGALAALGRRDVTENLLDMGAAAGPRRTLALVARDRSTHRASRTRDQAWMLCSISTPSETSRAT